MFCAQPHAADISSDKESYNPHLSLPEGSGHFPVIVLSHGAGGLKGSIYEWGKKFAAWGFATIVLDHYAPRGFSSENRMSTQDSFEYRRGDLISILKIINGQVAGGIIHGIGNALFERLYHDETGQPLTTTLAEYLLPTAPHIPSLKIKYSETRCTKNPIGVKGIGEGGTAPVPAVIISAEENALAPFGVVIDQTPIDPSKIVDLVRQSVPIS